MQNDLKTILEKFEADEQLLNEFAVSLVQLIKSLLSAEGIKPHQFDYRIKARNSIEKKIIRKEYKYEELYQITDLCGLRIITYFEDDIDKIAEILKKEFDIDMENSVDRRLIDADRFGYRSLHFVFQLKENRVNLTEYKKFKSLKAEIQLRTILQHSWAEIEHDLGYKGEEEIPVSARRTFSRVAALLEQADIEFLKLKGQLLRYEKAIATEIRENPGKVLISKSSLMLLIKNSKTIQEAENALNPQIVIRGEMEPEVVSGFVSDLNEFKIYTIKELEDKYAENIEDVKNTMIRLEAIKDKGKSPLKFPAGFSIRWLIIFLHRKDSGMKNEKILT